MAEAIEQTALEEEVVIDPNNPRLFIEEEEIVSDSVETNPTEVDQRFPDVPSHFLVPDSAAEPLNPSLEASPEEQQAYIDSLVNVKKIDLDFDEMLKTTNRKFGRPYTEDEIAEYVVEERFKDQFAPGDYQRIKDATGADASYILGQFTNVRTAGPFATVMEEFAKSSAPASAALAAGTITGSYGAAINPYLGPPAAIAGGIVGFLTADKIIREVAPEIYQPRSLSDRPYALASTIFGASMPAIRLPELIGSSSYGAYWLTGKYMPPRDRLNLGAEFVENNLNRWMGGGLRKAEDLSQALLRSAQTNPGITRALETRSIISAAGAGFTAEMLLPQDLPWRGVPLFGAEMVGAVADPVSMAARRLHRPLSAMARALTGGYDVDRLTLPAGQAINRLALEYGESYDVDYIEKLNALSTRYNGARDDPEFLEELTGLQSEYIMAQVAALKDPVRIQELEEYLGLSIEQQTAALRTGLPFYYILEGRMPQALGGTGTEQTTEIAELHALARAAMVKKIQALNNDGSPEALAAAAELRREAAEIDLNEFVGKAFDNYQRLSQEALAGGETLDTGAYFWNLFFNPEGNSLLGAIKAQSRALADAIPRNDPINLNPLIDAYNAINQKYRVVGQTPRISSGKDLVSLDVALRQFEDVLGITSDVPILPPVLSDAQQDVVDLKKLDLKEITDQIDGINNKLTWNGRVRRDRTRADYKDPSVDGPALQRLEIKKRGLENDIQNIENPIVEMPRSFADGEEVVVESGDVINFINVIDGRITSAVREQNGPLIDILTDLREGTLKSLGTSANEAAKHYYTFQNASARVFSNTFLGEMHTKISPQLIGSAFFQGTTDSVLSRLNQVGDAIKFMDEQGLTFGGSNLPELGPAGVAARDVRASDPAFNMQNFGSVQDLQEGFLRGMFNDPRYFRDVQKVTDGIPQFDKDDNPIMMKEATQALDAFVQKNGAMLETSFPGMAETLSNVQKSRATWEFLERTRDETRKESLDAFRRAFENRFDNPVVGVAEVIGTPDSRAANPALGNVTRETRLLAEIAVAAGPEVAEQLERTLIDNALTYARLNTTSQGVSEFDPALIKRYFDEPLGQGQPSLNQILLDANVIDDPDAILRRNFSNFWEQINLIDQSNPQRVNQIEGGWNTLRSAEDIDVEGATFGAAGRMLISISGAVTGSSIGRMFQRLPFISGGQAGLIAASEGAKLFRQIMLSTPELASLNLYRSLATDPDLMATVMQSAIDKAGNVLPPSTPDLRRIHAWLVGAGAIDPAQTTSSQFIDLWQENANFLDPERNEPAEAAAARRAAYREAVLAEEEEAAAPVIEEVEVEEVDATPSVGFTPPPPRQPVQPPPFQPPRAVAQGADPAMRSRYAAMYPNDTVSEVIRVQEGLGSLV